MTYGPAFVAQIHRLGQNAVVKKRTETGQNEFGNPTDEYTAQQTVIAFRTYPNRNTQVESNVGDLGRDNPVFLIAIGENQPAPPEENDHLVYDGTEYEVKSPTVYDTHIEVFGDVVRQH